MPTPPCRCAVRRRPTPAVAADLEHDLAALLRGATDFALALEAIDDIEHFRDMGRTDSPLRPAADAHLLDTSEMSIEAAFQAARAVVDGALAKRNTV